MKKIHYIIPIINVIIIVIAWVIIRNLGQEYINSLIEENSYNFFDGFGVAIYIFFIQFGFFIILTLCNLLGAILFLILKKKEIYQGLALGFLLNLILLISVFLINNLGY